MRTPCWLAGLLAMAAATSIARAAEVAERARLVYAVDAAASARCPDERALRRAVVQRLGHDPFWEWAPREILVLIRKVPHGYSAHVVSVDVERRSATRDLKPDADCAEEVTAAALAVSIVLDGARVQGVAVAAPAPPQPAPQPPPAPPPFLAPPPPPPFLAPVPASDRVTPPAPASSTPPRYAVGADAAGFVGVTPRPGVSLDAFADLRRRRVSIGAELLVGAATPADAMQAMIAAVGLAPCLRFGPAFACALGQLGWVQLWNNVVAHGSLFALAGARAGVEWALSARSFLRIQGDLRFTVYQPHSLVGGTLYQASMSSAEMPGPSSDPSRFGGALAIGVGAYIP